MALQNKDFAGKIIGIQRVRHVIDEKFGLTEAFINWKNERLKCIGLIIYLHLKRKSQTWTRIRTLGL